MQKRLIYLGTLIISLLLIKTLLFRGYTLTWLEHIVMIALVAIFSFQILWFLLRAILDPDLSNMPTSIKSENKRLFHEFKEKQADFLRSRITISDYLTPIGEGVFLFYGLSLAISIKLKSPQQPEITPWIILNGLVLGIIYACTKRVIEIVGRWMIIKIHEQKLGL